MQNNQKTKHSTLAGLFLVAYVLSGYQLFLNLPYTIEHNGMTWVIQNLVYYAFILLFAMVLLGGKRNMAGVICLFGIAALSFSSNVLGIVEVLIWGTLAFIYMQSLPQKSSKAKATAKNISYLPVVLGLVYWVTYLTLLMGGEYFSPLYYLYSTASIGTFILIFAMVHATTWIVKAPESLMAKEKMGKLKEFCVYGGLAVVGIISGLYGQFTTPDKVVLYASVATHLYFVYCLFTYPRNLAARQSNDDANKVEFYKKCIEHNITDVSSAANKQKAELIAQSLGHDGYTSIEDYFNACKAVGDEKDNQAEQALKGQAHKDLIATEKLRYKDLTRFTAYVGREKRIAMLTDQAKQLNLEIAAKRQEQNSASRYGQQKEHDWATHGGIASGIAGGAAGLAVAMDMQAKNADIRAHNQAMTQFTAPLQMKLMDDMSKLRKSAEKLEKQIADAKLKLVEDLNGDELLSHLDISFKSLSVSKTGAATVKAVVKSSAPLVIFENVPAVVDGTICANIYQQQTKIGTALLALPAFGAQQAHTLEGMILSGAKEGEKYRVEFSCNKLWGIEK